MTARTRQQALCLEAAERDAKLAAFVNAVGRYHDDAAYRARVDAERAARQAEVHARMNAAVAAYRERLA